MPLFVVATPIGNPQDFSQRALSTLKEAELIVGEELKVLRQTLKAAGVQAPAMDQLNEHSDERDIAHLLNECRSKRVALVSDCGTPGFCDPGADLVKACQENGVQVVPVPGASSLMSLLSVCGARVEEFLFKGFLPAKTELRARAWRELQNESRALILMETPYRCEKWLQELGETFKDRMCVLGLNLTQESERVIRAKARDLAKLAGSGAHEPIVLVLPLITAKR